MSVERLGRGFGQVGFRVLAVATCVELDRCPICLSPVPTSEEHVPPESLGGMKMALTCAPCNNGFGSHLEAVLLDWGEDAYSLVRLEHDNVQGPRRVARVLLRQTPAGRPVVLAHRPDPAFSDALAPGTNFTMHIRPPERVRWRLGAIKSAFLGACLLLHEIPQSPEADAIRADLLAARDAPRSATLAESDHCASLTVHRTQEASGAGRDRPRSISARGTRHATDVRLARPNTHCVLAARRAFRRWRRLGGSQVMMTA